MTSFRTIRSDAPMYDKFGVLTGSVTLITFPDEECDGMKLKADANNGGAFLIGEAGSGLTSFPLEAGDEVGWTNTSNLDRYTYSNVSGTMDYLYWWIQK